MTARLIRQAIFDRRPAPLLSFVMCESVRRRRFGGNDVLRGQLEHLLLIGQRRNVELQIMPLDSEENSGVDGPFTVVTREDGKKFLYVEAQGTSSLETDPKQVALAAARYGITVHRLSSVQAWLAAPPQVQIWSWLPSVVLQSVTSRHLPEPVLIRLPFAPVVHAWAPEPLQS